MKKNISLNIISAIFCQLISVLIGFVVPKVMLNSYGSEVNGLLVSIAQYLSVINIVEFGIGAVVPAALYSPLLDNDFQKVNDIFAGARKMYRSIGYIFIAYALLIAVIYPSLITRQYDYAYITALIIVMAIYTFTEYFFATSETMILVADRKSYIKNFLYSFVVIVNCILTLIMAERHVDIIILRLASTCVFLIRPLFVNRYVKQRYQVKLKVIDKSALKNKWDAVWHHISNFVLCNTDVLILTVATSLIEVSIYSIFFMVVNGIYKLLDAVNNSVMANLGNILASKEQEKVRRYWNRYEIGFRFVSVVIWGCVILMINDFVQLYTHNITDADYNQPVLALFISLAYYFCSIRLPYTACAFSSGNFKSTKNIFVLSAIINVVVSVALVYFFKINGVVLGTLLAMLIQLIMLSRFSYDNILLIRKINLRLITVIDVFLISFYSLIYWTGKDYLAVSLEAFLVKGVICFIFVVSTSALVYFIFLYKRFFFEHSRMLDN